MSAKPEPTGGGDVKRTLPVALVSCLGLLMAAACGAGVEPTSLSEDDPAAAAVDDDEPGTADDPGEMGLGGSLNDDGSEEEGCTKVDFLFVIDNSVSMRDQQAALIASFPGFINTIQSTVAAKSDYHVMVADTDDWGRCTSSNCASGAMSADSLCVAPAGGYACNTTFDTCDKTIGSGVVHPAGDGATNAPCTIYGGNRYMIEGEPDLVGTFACVAQVGLAGHPAERPMDSLVAAMGSDLNGAAGCNDGFLRDDAILVVTFISDDPNYEDAGVPQDWYDAVVAAKGGNADAVVVLGLIPDPPKGAHWSEFVALWGDHGLEASVKSLDYAPFFAQAVDIIDETCDGFTPPS
jgi:hypothetical protein